MVLHFFKRPGPGYSKPAMSLVNVLLEFQTLISEICQYFLLKKCEELCSAKASTAGFSHFFNKKYQCIWLLSRKTLNELTTYKLVKLRML